MQRSNLRLQARVLAAWAERQEQKVAMQAALRTAVRRMSFLKLYHAFTGEGSAGCGQADAFCRSAIA